MCVCVCISFRRELHRGVSPGGSDGPCAVEVITTELDQLCASLAQSSLPQMYAAMYVNWTTQHNTRVDIQIWIEISIFSFNVG